MRRLIWLAVALAAFLRPAGAGASGFDVRALAEYALSDETDVGYVTVFEQSGSWFSEWTYQTDFDEYDWELRFSDGTAGCLRLDFALAGQGDMAVPLLMAEGVCEAPMALAGLSLSAGGGVYGLSFEKDDARLALWEEYDGEYEFSLTCYLGSGGLAFWRELRGAQGALQLTLTRQDGCLAQITQSAMPPWDERQAAQSTALDLFLDGLARAGYVRGDGVPTQETLDWLRVVEQSGMAEGLRVSGSPENGDGEALAV